MYSEHSNHAIYIKSLQKKKIRKIKPRNTPSSTKTRKNQKKKTYKTLFSFHHNTIFSVKLKTTSRHINIIVWVQNYIE